MISITLNDTQAVKKIDEIAKQLKNPRLLYAELGEQLIQQHKKRIDKGEDPTGKKWKPLQPWYNASKKGKGILRESGQLRNTLAYNLKPNGLEFGSPVEYAPVHQFGAIIKPKRKKALALGGGELGFAKKVNVPARPWLGVSDNDAKDLEEKAVNHLRKVIARIGG